MKDMIELALLYPLCGMLSALFMVRKRKIMDVDDLLELLFGIIIGPICLGWIIAQHLEEYGLFDDIVKMLNTEIIKED